MHAAALPDGERLAFGDDDVELIGKPADHLGRGHPAGRDPGDGAAARVRVNEPSTVKVNGTPVTGAVGSETLQIVTVVALSVPTPKSRVAPISVHTDVRRIKL
jgi:hypothetical protein